MLLSLYSTVRQNELECEGHGSPFLRTVLSSNQRIQEVLPVFAFQRDNLPASPPAIRFEIESFPQMINGGRSWICSNIEQHTDTTGPDARHQLCIGKPHVTEKRSLWLQNWTKCTVHLIISNIICGMWDWLADILEEPSVTIDLLCVVFLFEQTAYE
jgi:hypothetical protein